MDGNVSDSCDLVVVFLEALVLNFLLLHSYQRSASIFMSSIEITMVSWNRQALDFYE